VSALLRPEDRPCPPWCRTDHAPVNVSPHGEWITIHAGARRSLLVTHGECSYEPAPEGGERPIPEPGYVLTTSLEGEDPLYDEPGRVTLEAAVRLLGPDAPDL